MAVETAKSNSNAETDAFIADVVKRLIEKGVHPARAQKAASWIRFVPMSDGRTVARVRAEYGPIESWHDGAASVLMSDLDRLAPEIPWESYSARIKAAADRLQLQRAAEAKQSTTEE